MNELPARKQFGIVSLLSWTIIAALVLIVILNHGTITYQTWQFDALPSDERALQAWLDSNVNEKIVATRESEEQKLLRLERRTRSLQNRRPFGSTLSIPTPPWEELGYERPGLSGGGETSGLFVVSYGNVVAATVAALVLLILLNWLNLRGGKPARPTVDQIDQPGDERVLAE